MPQSNHRSTALRWMVGVAAFCVVMAGIKLAASLIVPLLLAMVIAVVCMPSLKWLQAHGLPTFAAIVLVLLAVASVGVLLPLFVGASLRSFLDDVDEYQGKFVALERQAVGWLKESGVEGAEQVLDEWFDPAAAWSLLEDTGKSLLLIFANALLVLILVAFMLAEASYFPAKVQASFPESRSVRSSIAEVIENIWRYLAIKTVISLATGGLVALLLAAIGVKYALLWGFIAFCFNYIPNVGSFIAAIPAVGLALLDIGIGAALGVGVGYLAINNIMGGVIEPRLQGRGLGLSPLVVLISLMFWYFELGIVGALLSAPLTMAVKIACEANPDTEWIAVMLGPKLRDEPADDEPHSHGEAAESQP